MKYAQFQKIIKPIFVLIIIFAFVGAVLIIFTMLSDIYKDTSTYGVIQSVNGSSITLTDGQTFYSSVQDLSKYCQPGEDVRIKIEQYTSIWCNNSQFNVSTLEDFL